MSLAQLAQKLVEMIKIVPTKQIDLSEAARKLGVSKRRIYDITNVFEGKRTGINSFLAFEF